ncbi:MAG TPA: ClpXP protease specificity-enhancing factor SspB [Micropepsaceae bacterium]|nr:ClpXP protease specificity-enhancing factor SspB [Micropepsaceae bacterium]
MAKDWMNYEALAQAAMRGVVRMAIERAATQGLPGDHHFYITFETSAPGVGISDALRERFPDEMTIVLQHQYWGLKTTEEAFEVTLTFSKMPETLTIPWTAIKSFFDPSVKFGLQFRAGLGGSGVAAPGKSPAAKAPAAKTPTATGAKEATKLDPARKDAEAKAPAKDGEGSPAEAKPAAPGEVVSLDAFRKK